MFTMIQIEVNFLQINCCMKYHELVCNYQKNVSPKHINKPSLQFKDQECCIEYQ